MRQASFVQPMLQNLSAAVREWDRRWTVMLAWLASRSAEQDMARLASDIQAGIQLVHGLMGWLGERRRRLRRARAAYLVAWIASHKRPGTMWDEALDTRAIQQLDSGDSRMGIAAVGAVVGAMHRALKGPVEQVMASHTDPAAAGRWRLLVRDIDRCAARILALGRHGTTSAEARWAKVWVVRGPATVAVKRMPGARRSPAPVPPGRKATRHTVVGGVA